VNIDAQLVRDGGHLARGEERLVELSNGCICCTLREDLLLEVRRLAEAGRFDHLLIESTGISEPMPVAETFTFQDDAGRALSDVAYLESLVTVVDAAGFLREYEAADALAERGLALSEADDRTVVDLLVDQVEFADTLVVNQIDRVTERERDRLLAILARLNPDARLLPVSFGRVPVRELLGTTRFDLDRASAAPGWLKTLRGEEVPESETHGIRSFVFRAARPFHPERFHALVHRDWPGLLRSKGFFWLATRHDIAGVWAQAGGACRHAPAGFWWAARPPSEWPDDPEALEALRRRWDPAWGDRRQELVFIGVELDVEGLQAALHAALLTDAEMDAGPVGWRRLADPFPHWSVMEASSA
jgi:G3E family GTPase